MSHREIVGVLGVLMLGVLLAAMVQTSLSTALPTIAGELGGIAQVSWLVTAYLVTMTAATPLLGKASDLYGRKAVLQVSVVVFTVGSLFAGLAGDIWTLVAARAVQGVGAGGLISLPLAVVGDLVPARQRGRYQGYFGAVFGVASVIGPALAGFFVEVLTWRWIFYVNVPFGIVTFVVLTRTLTLRHHRREHRLDYLGAGLLVAAVSAILLVLVWGGHEYAWTSPMVLGLSAAGIVLTTAFVAVESRAKEPILPLRLLRNPVFTVANSTGFLVGVAMFGTLIYMPVYLQIVQGMSPVASGMMMLPVMTGFLATSILSGRLISRFGRYKVFPVVGSGCVTAGTALLAFLGSETSLVTVGLAMTVVGAGLGGVMQVLVLAVQNAVDPSDLGVATSSASFFRTTGGAFGTALLGSVLAARLNATLPDLLPLGTSVSPSRVTGAPETIAALPGPVHAAVVEAFSLSLQTVYLVAVPVSLMAFVLACWLREIPLHDRDASAAESSTLA